MSNDNDNSEVYGSSLENCFDDSNFKNKGSSKVVKVERNPVVTVFVRVLVAFVLFFIILFAIGFIMGWNGVKPPNFSWNVVENQFNKTTNGEISEVPNELDEK